MPRSLRPLLRVSLSAATACADRVPRPAFPAPLPILEWAAAVDTLPGTYTRVMRPAEFWDSVLVVPDVRERVPWRVDMARGTREPLGSQGAGPGEDERLSWAAKVHRDSVAILQGFAWSPFPVISVSTGRGRTVSFRNGQEAEGARAFVLAVAQPQLHSADTLGHVYGKSMRPAPEIDSATRRPLPGTGGMFDTLPIVRYSIGTSLADTLAMFPAGVPRMPAGRDASGAMTLAMGLGPYGAYNLWAPTAAGELLFVDAAEYRVRLMDRNLLPIANHTLPFNPVPVTQAGWDAYVQNTTNGSIVLIEKTMRDVSAQIGKAMPRPAGPRYVVPDMPATLPAVSSGDGVRPMYTFDQIAWIPVNRIDPPGPEFWDVIDLARGVRLRTVAFPDNHRLVLVTSRGAYVVAKDDDDLERILLYRTSAAPLTPSTP